MEKETQKKKRGRPCKPESEQRRNHLSIWLTDEELGDLDAHAEDRGLGRSVAARRLIAKQLNPPEFSLP